MAKQSMDEIIESKSALLVKKAKCMKGRKTHEAKSQFVLTLLLIGREEDASFLDKLHSVLKQSSHELLSRLTLL